MDTKKILANNIYMLRNKYKLTQQEFVNKLNCKFTRGHISKIETGVNIPSAEFIKSVCESFNVSSEWLLGINDKGLSSIKSMTNAEIDLLFNFRTLPVDIQKDILNLIVSISKAQNK